MHKSYCSRHWTKECKIYVKKSISTYDNWLVYYLKRHFSYLENKTQRKKNMEIYMLLVWKIMLFCIVFGFFFVKIPEVLSCKTLFITDPSGNYQENILTNAFCRSLLMSRSILCINTPVLWACVHVCMYGFINI